MATDGPRFHIDDSVYLVPQKDTRYKDASLERFTIIAVMPPDRAGTHQYRIRPTGPGPQRMATELELRR
jgi:hypothetical protein